LGHPAAHLATLLEAPHVLRGECLVVVVVQERGTLARVANGEHAAHVGPSAHPNRLVLRCGPHGKQASLIRRDARRFDGRAEPGTPRDIAVKRHIVQTLCRLCIQIQSGPKRPRASPKVKHSARIDKKRVVAGLVAAGHDVLLAIDWRSQIDSRLRTLREKTKSVN
jgi:hypothetical protein